MPNNLFDIPSYDFGNKTNYSNEDWRRSETTHQEHYIENYKQVNRLAYISFYNSNFESSSAWFTPQKPSFRGPATSVVPYSRVPRNPKIEILRLHYRLKWSSLVKDEINDFPKASQITSATEKSTSVLPKPFPIISGIGAEMFQKELETMEYPEHIKSFYKDSKELVRKLGLFP